MRLTKRLSVAMAVGLMVGPGFLGRSPSAQAEQPMKVGYVDVSRLFDEYERTKRSEGLLEQKGKQKEVELEQRLGELKKLREGLELLSNEARDARAREIDKRADELRRLGAYSKRDLVKERDQIAQEILREIRQVVQEYAKANNFTLLFDRQGLLFGQDAYDMTDEVLAQLNSREGAPRQSRKP